MNEGLARQIELALRATVPVLLILLAAILTLMPAHTALGLAVVPHLPLAVIFYWSLYRPDLLAASAVFAIGLVDDILCGSTLGLNALLLLGVYGVMINQRKIFHAKPFAIVWWGFGVVAATAFFSYWLISSMLAGIFEPWQPMIAECMSTLILFPLIFWVMSWVQRRIVPLPRDAMIILRAP